MITITVEQNFSRDLIDHIDYEYTETVEEYIERYNDTREDNWSQLDEKWKSFLLEYRRNRIERHSKKEVYRPNGWFYTYSVDGKVKWVKLFHKHPEEIL